MYLQNFSSQQSQGQQSKQKSSIQEQDWGNLLLSELKRTAREYTTAALEGTNPAIRQAFQNLAQKTMQDQAGLFTVLAQLNGYGSIKAAGQQEIQQELQQHSQKAEQLQSLVQQALQSAYTAGSGIYQQQSEQFAHQTSQPFQQTQAQSYQPQYSGASQGFQSSQYGQNQNYTSGYNNPGSNQAFNQTPGSSFGYGQQEGITAKSASPGSGGSKFASSGNPDQVRGGNSFDWTGSDESRNTSSGSTSPSRTNDHNSKYMM